ncbi:MAG: cyclodeaminase/cyclohydrolase family protein [Chloroflexota bacterium]
MADRSLAGLSVDDFLRRLASGDPTPGGGSASALGGALGAALVSMVCNLTIGRERYADTEAEVTEIREAAQSLLDRLRRGIDEDAEAYDRVIAAYRLPRGTDDDKAARSEAIQEATRLAALAPLGLVEASAEVIGLAERALGKTNPHAVSDLAVAALFGVASLDGAAANVEINLTSLKDEAARDEIAARLATARAGARERASGVVERAQT